MDIIIELYHLGQLNDIKKIRYKTLKTLKDGFQFNVGEYTIKIKTQPSQWDILDMHVIQNKTKRASE